MKSKIDRNKIGDFYNTLLSSISTERKRKSLQIVYEVLLDQYENSSNNFSIAHIGNQSKRKGGPIEQTIRNKDGKEFRELIKFFADNVGVSNSSSYKEYELSDYIEDPGLKAHINILIAENKSLKNQLNILKQNMSKNYELVYNNDSDTLDGSRELSYIKNPLNRSEIDAIRKFAKDIDNNCSPIKLTSTGSLKDENGLLVANPGFFEGLKKMLASI